MVQIKFGKNSLAVKTRGNDVVEVKEKLGGMEIIEAIGKTAEDTVRLRASLVPRTANAFEASKLLYLLIPGSKPSKYQQVYCIQFYRI